MVCFNAALPQNRCDRNPRPRLEFPGIFELQACTVSAVRTPRVLGRQWRHWSACSRRDSTDWPRRHLSWHIALAEAGVIWKSPPAFRQKCQRTTVQTARVALTPEATVRRAPHGRHRVPQQPGASCLTSPRNCPHPQWVNFQSAPTSQSTRKSSQSGDVHIVRDGRPSGARRWAFDSGSTGSATARLRAAGTRPPSWRPRHESSRSPPVTARPLVV